MLQGFKDLRTFGGFIRLLDMKSLSAQSEQCNYCTDESQGSEFGRTLLGVPKTSPQASEATWRLTSPGYHKP